MKSEALIVIEILEYFILSHLGERDDTTDFEHREGREYLGHRDLSISHERVDRIVPIFE